MRPSVCMLVRSWHLAPPDFVLASEEAREARHDAETSPLPSCPTACRRARRTRVLQVPAAFLPSALDEVGKGDGGSFA